MSMTDRDLHTVPKILRTELRAGATETTGVIHPHWAAVAAGEPTGLPARHRQQDAPTRCRVRLTLAIAAALTAGGGMAAATIALAPVLTALAGIAVTAGIGWVIWEVLP